MIIESSVRSSRPTQALAEPPRFRALVFITPRPAGWNVNRPAKMFVVLTLYVPERLTLPAASSIEPVPVMLEVAPRLCVPPPKRRVPGKVEINAPELAPPTESDSTVLLTKTVPLLLNGNWKFAEPAPEMRDTVPVFTKRLAPALPLNHWFASA